LEAKLTKNALCNGPAIASYLYDCFGTAGDGYAMARMAEHIAYSAFHYSSFTALGLDKAQF
jgi:hypothetical protein